MVKPMTKVVAPMVIMLTIVIATTPAIEAQVQAKLGTAERAALHKMKNEVFVLTAATPIELHGRLVAFDAAALTIEVDGRSYSFPSNEVVRIDVLSENRAARGALIGGVVLAAWSALVGGQGLDDGESLAPMVAANAGLGAGIGALIGMNRKARRTIYRAAGTVAAAARSSAELPCPATPLVASAPLVVPHRTKWRDDTWFGDFRSLGEKSCDGLSIRRLSDDSAGTWQSGVDLRFRDSGRDTVTITARITADLPTSDRKKIAVVLLEILDGAVVLASATANVKTYPTRDGRQSVDFKVPAPVLANSPNLLLRMTLLTRYE